MIVQAIMFYVFAALAVAAGVLVVSSRNPVHSVLFLIVAFFNAAGLFVLIGAEFQAAGLILLVAMIGAIVLTLRRRADVRRQSIPAQLARTRAQTVEVVKVPIGGGSR